MDNLYFIQARNGETVRFNRWWNQRDFSDKMHGRDIILKSRRLGFSTFIDLFLLDLALFRPGTSCGIVADTEDNAAELFRTKVKFPYEHLPVQMQESLNLVTDNKTQVEFTNGSVIKVGVSLVSQSHYAVHVSELGKIAVEHPEKAQEIIAGSLPTVPTDGYVFIESTARGHSGLFYDWWTRCSGHSGELTELDYRPHFYPWYIDPDCTLSHQDAIGVVVPARLEEFFSTLNVKLTMEQKAWYVKTEEQQGDLMGREYPSTPEDAFRDSIEGAYFSRQMAEARKEGRILPIPVEPGYDVDTWWDLGMSDSMAIWFSQCVADQVRLVDYYEGAGEGLPHYVEVLKRKGYRYGTHWAPHDIRVRELNGLSRLEYAAGLGLMFHTVPRVENKMDSIEAARQILGLCWFDQVRCQEGIKHLDNYRKAWDEVHGVWANHPLHDKHSDGADAFQTLAMGLPHGAATRRRGMITGYKSGGTANKKWMV